MGVFAFFTGRLICRRLIISLPWLHNFVAIVGRLRLYCWLTCLLPTSFFASTTARLHYHRLVSLFLPPPTSSSSLMGDIIFMLVISPLCRLHQLPSMDNCNYNKSTSYMLRGSSTQMWGSYLQFGLISNTCNMNLWSWIDFLCSKIGPIIISCEGHQLSTCASWDWFSHLLWYSPWGIITRIRSYSDEIRLIYITQEIYHSGLY